MNHTTLKRNGGWTIELVEPLQGSDGPVNEIVFQPLRAEHTIRWAEGQITSTFGLIAELTKQPEVLLRQLIAVDFDRVMLAFYNMIPPLIKKDFEAGARPLASDIDDLPVEVATAAVDQNDPRFPYVPGLDTSKIKKPEVVEDTGSITAKPPETMRPVT